MSDVETAVTVTVPPEARQVLIRVPGKVGEVQVDFRQRSGDTWTPSDFWPDSVVAVRVQ